METKKHIDKIKKQIDDYNDGYLEMDLGYKFRTKQFLSVLFLYINSVDTRNPDILGRNNKNTFVYEALQYVEKVKEQVRLDLKDLNFLVDAPSLAAFIPKAANRKMLEDNDFATVIDEIPDNAIDFGSGFLKLYEIDKVMKMKSIDPYFLIFDQYNFKKGYKIEKIRRTYRDLIDNDKYEVEAREKLSKIIEPEKLDEFTIVYQAVYDYPDKTQGIYVVDIENDLMFYEYEGKPQVHYYKYDAKKRKGFPDALGVGYNERIFNKLVQSKVNRERLDKVMQIASKLPFQKMVDNENDSLVGKEVLELETGVIVGYGTNPIQPLDTGGTKQYEMLKGQINEIMQTIGNDLNVGEALQGNTLPSGTSGVLGNLLTENSSSVLKEVKKAYANWLDLVYREQLIEYILGIFDKDTDLRKYLTGNDIKLVERSVVNYNYIQKYIEAEINGEVFDPASAMEQTKKEVKGKKLISGELLKTLKDEVGGIRTFISGEDVSKPQVVAFLREMRTLYMSNPQVFQDPFFVDIIKKEAEFDSGLSGVEIDLLLNQLQDNNLTQSNVQEETQTGAIPQA